MVRVPDGGPMHSQITGGKGIEEISAPKLPEPFAVFGGFEGAAAALLIALVTGLLIRRRELHWEREQNLLRPSGEGERFGLQVRRECAGGSSEPEAPLVCGEFWDASATRFCPVCRAEYIAGTVCCEDCGLELVDEDDVPEGEVIIQEGTVRVIHLGNSFHGQLVREFLAANRIPCFVQRCTAWDLFGADVYVFESDALRAKKLIRHFLADLDVAVV